MNTLADLYAAHDGKVSDKWSLYLVEYERLLAPYRDRAVDLLEIGIQNGGSLELWSRYFSFARHLVGCDINPDCAKLTYDDPRIRVVVGDANHDATEQEVSAIAERFDVIIDDGSHRSSDVVRSFARWFARLADGGIYIAEDLHCSYWLSYEGGLHDPASSVAFFKALCDVVSHEHWGLARTRAEELAVFSQRYAVDLDEALLEHVHSVEVVDSMCIVRKAAPSGNVLGRRVIAGRQAIVVPGVRETAGTEMVVPPQIDVAALREASIARDVLAVHEALQTREIEVAELRRKLLVKEAELLHKERELALLTSSSSWKLTTPIRTTSKAVRRQFHTHGPVVFNRIPGRYRVSLLEWGYRHLAPLFEGHPGFERWKQTGVHVASTALHAGKMVRLSTIDPATAVSGSIAIHLHVFYEDLAEELRAAIENMPFEYDLYVTVAHAEGERVCRRVFTGLARCGTVHVAQVPNRGRDIAAMFCMFGRELARYDFVAHLHSKKSLYNKGATEGWRQYLVSSLLGTEAQIRRIFTLLTGDAPHGIVYPQNFHMLSYTCNTWLANRQMGRAWCARVGISPVPDGYFDFPAGSMFWARGDALRPLFDTGITVEDFAVEAGQTDGTFAHCLERLLVLSSLKQGMPAGILADEVFTTWSAWRFDQYLGRTREYLLHVFASPVTKVIGFDIYDTLLLRPLLDAESVKKIVARRAGEHGATYLEHRAAAEQQAREIAGRDVGLDQVYAQLEARTGLAASTIAELRALEERVEKESVQPRPDLVALFADAVRTGKPVVLISDMFLPRAIIEAQLAEHGISGWDALLLSNEVGLRKDTGAMYDHLYARYGIGPKSFVMLGDNERSDIQIPSDKGALGQHVLRPLEMARGWPRFSPLVETYEHTTDLDAEISLGLVVRRSFASFLPPHADPSSLLGSTPFSIGYGIAGPLLVAFSEWVLETARRDDMQRLYFVAREGRLMKRVFEAWAAGRSDVPRVEYLVLSRRAVGVPLLETREDIFTMATPDYWPSPIADFLRERFGHVPSAQRWKELGWDPSREIELRSGDLTEIAPLLEALTDELLALGRAERPPLEQYLRDVGLGDDARSALVDVGYSGTIQRFLNRLLPRPVHGYYMMTNDRPAAMAKKLEVLVRGCFVDGIPHVQDVGPLMYWRSFELEKLLSSDDPQVLRYEHHGANVRPVFRPLTDEEKATSTVREEVQAGVMRYVEDARQVKAFVPDWRPSTEVAQRLFESFVGAVAPSETLTLRSIVLDDHHHGRGVVR